MFQRVLEGDERVRNAVIDADLTAIPRPQITHGPDGVRRTSHVISLEMPPAPVAFPPARARFVQDITRRYYELFDWDPDFLLTYQPGFRSVALPSATFQETRNDVSGIGRAAFDQTADFASGGNLQGVVWQPHGIALGGGLLVHELGHRWFVKLDPQLGLSNGGHWSSQLDRMDSAFRGGPYNDVELYLMGLVPSDSVRPARIGTNGVTISDVIALHGAREPAWPTAQSSFTAAAIVVAPRLLSDELALYHFLMADFAAAQPHPIRGPDATTFFEATGGRARIDTRIPLDAAR